MYSHNEILKAKIDKMGTSMIKKFSLRIMKCEVVKYLIIDYKFNKNFDIVIDYQYKQNMLLLPTHQTSIGRLVMEIDFVKLQEFHLKVPVKQNLNQFYDVIDDILGINEQYFIISGLNMKFGQRSISIFDSYCNERRVFLSLNNKKIDFSMVNGIKMDSDLVNHIFLCLKKLNKLVVCDLGDFNRVTHEIYNDQYDISDETMFTELVDVRFNQGLIYILDKVKGIHVFDLNGERKHIIYLYVPNFNSKYYDITKIKNPYEMEIFNNFIVILSNFETLYVFDLNGNYKLSKESKNTRMCSVDDKYLACIDYDCKLNMYEIKFEEETDENISLKETFSTCLTSFEIKNSLAIYNNCNCLLILTPNCRLNSIQIK